MALKAGWLFDWWMLFSLVPFQNETSKIGRLNGRSIDWLVSWLVDFGDWLVGWFGAVSERDAEGWSVDLLICWLGCLGVFVVVFVGWVVGYIVFSQGGDDVTSANHWMVSWFV